MFVILIVMFWMFSWLADTTTRDVHATLEEIGLLVATVSARGSSYIPKNIGDIVENQIKPKQARRIVRCELRERL